MKVVQSVTGINQEASGPSYSVPGLCRGLMSNGVSVEIHKIGKQRCNDFPFTVYGYPAHRWPIRTIWRSPEMLAGLRKACADADILHTNGLWTMPTVYPGWVARNNGLRLVLSPRGSLAEWALSLGKLRKRLFGILLQGRVCRLVDMWHATSVKEYEEIRGRGYKQPVAIVPIGMDLPDISSEFRVKSCELGLRLKRVVFFGRLHRVKAVDNLVLAWGNVAERFPDWELVVAGPDCGVLGELKSRISGKRIPRVSFVGEIKGAAKYEFLASADIYVLPSHTENFAITIAEALACGTPVIASQGTPWAGLEREKAGRWVPIGVEPLVEALREVMSMNDEERRQMGERGREWIARDFSWKGIGAKMKASYEWLLGKSDKPEWVKVD